MKSRRAALASGAAGALGMTWLSRDRWSRILSPAFRDYAGPYDQPRRFLPVVAHCHAEGIEVSDLPRWSR